MSVIEIECHLSKAIAIILHYFRSDRKEIIPEGAVQKTLSILMKGVNLNIPDANITHSKQGWMIGGLHNLPSKYYEVKEIKSKRTGEHLRYVFKPKIDVIEQDFSRRDFLESPLPRYVKPLSRFYKTKGGKDNLVFISLFLMKDGGFYDVGHGIFNAVEESRKLVFSRINKETCFKSFKEFMKGVSNKIKILEYATAYSRRLRNIAEKDPDTDTILSFVNHLDSEDKDLSVLLKILIWLKDDVKELGKFAYDIRRKGLIDQYQLFKKPETDTGIYDLLIQKMNSMNYIVCNDKTEKLSSEQRLNKLCNKYESWAFATMSAAFLADYRFRGTHWKQYTHERCEGDKIIVWADAIGSSKIEGYLNEKYPEKKDDLLVLWHQRFHTIIRNWGIVFDALVPPEGITIEGDQMVLLYDSLLQALLGSCLAIFFSRQINKLIEDDNLKIGYKILISHGHVVRGPSLDTDFLGKIKIVKPKECVLLEHTKEGSPKEGYIIIDKEFCESNLRLFGEYQRFLYKTQVVSGNGSSLIEVYSVRIEELIRHFVENIH